MDGYWYVVMDNMRFIAYLAMFANIIATVYVIVQYVTSDTDGYIGKISLSSIAKVIVPIWAIIIFLLIFLPDFDQLDKVLERKFLWK